MDGFYVCKIQKLSDKIKGESDEMNEKGAENTEKASSSAEGKGRDETRSKSKNGHKKKRGAIEVDMPKKKAKTDKISVPPPLPRNSVKKEKKVSAKLSKPRRIKPEKMM